MKLTLLLLACLSTVSPVRAGAEWTSLFDGKTLANWSGPDGANPEGWVVEETGVLHFTAKGRELLTEKEYTNFELEWEWKLARGGNNGRG